jgi:transmembrane sensor
MAAYSMEKIYDILPNYFAGKASLEEQQLVEQWANEHSREFAFLKLAWEESPGMEIRQFNAEKGWKKVQQQINTKARPEAKRRFLSPRILSLTAAAAVLLIGAFAFWNWWTENRLHEFTAGAEVLAIELPDGSSVDLNRFASLSYRGDFQKGNREVSLSGEAFFDVAHNPERPFSIESGNAKVSVLGTSFTVSQNKEAVEVVVASGKVEVKNKLSEERTLLTPGMRAEVKGQEVKTSQNENPNFLAWKTGKFSFSDIPLLSALQDLNNYYNDKIRISKGLQSDCLVNAGFEQQPLAQVMETLAAICELEVERLEEYYILKPHE